MATRFTSTGGGAENLPTLSSEWYVPPGAPQSGPGSRGEGFDPLNGRHRVRRRGRSRRSAASGDETMSDDDEEGSHYSGSDESGSESESESSSSESGSESGSDSEDEFFEASTDVQRKWRRLSLTSPNGPFEDTPTPSGPGHRSDCADPAHRAETSARYYSEAYLTGIPPTHADAAARSVDGRKKWWGALQASSNVSDVSNDSAHGSVSSGADSAAERGEAGSVGDKPVGGGGGGAGGWSHTGDAAVTASLVPELKPFTLPTVESIFGEAPSTAPRPFDGSLHAVGLSMKRNLEHELGLDRKDQDGQDARQQSLLPSMAESSTGASTPTSSRRTSSRANSVTDGSSAQGSVSETEAEDISGVFDDDDAASEGAASAKSSSEDEEKGSFHLRPSQQRQPGAKKKRSRKFSRFSTALQDHEDKDKDILDYKEFPELNRALTQTRHLDRQGSVDMTQLDQLDALRARVCSPDPLDEPLDTGAHQLTEAEFQDCLEDHPFDVSGEIEPVVDPFEDEEFAMEGQQQQQQQVQLVPQGQGQGHHSRRRRSSRGSRRDSRGSVCVDEDLCPEQSDWCAAPSAQQQALIGAPQAHPTPLQVVHNRRISDCKSSLLRHLSSSGGNVTDPNFLASLSQLRALASQAGMDVTDYASDSSRALEGMWLTLSRPNYHDCLGKNTHRTSTNPSSPSPTEGEYMYSLGRMSFDMFRPTDLVCSVQGVFNPCHRVDAARREEVESVPRGLRREIEDGETCLRTYNIVTAFTVETPPQPPSRRESACSSQDESSSSDSSSSSAAAPEPNLSGNSHVARPIRGIQTTYGYVLPDPQTPNRLSVWFTGGTLECNDPENDGAEWRRVFCKDEEDDAASTAGAGSAHSGSSTETGGGMGGALPKRRHLSERAKCLAARLLLGACLPERMEDDGTMSYRLTRPIGGHGTAYIDVLYLDDTLRILRGHHGTVYVFARVPGEE